MVAGVCLTQLISEACCGGCWLVLSFDEAVLVVLAWQFWERQRGTRYSHFNVYEVDVQFYLGIFKKRQILPNFNFFRATEST